MTCYRLYLLCPIQAIQKQNILNEKCLNILAKQNNGFLYETRKINGSILHVVDICDKDASEFVWQLPYPFTVLFVLYRDSEDILFEHRIFKRRNVCVSRNLSDKAVYWASKAIEKHIGVSTLKEQQFF